MASNFAAFHLLSIAALLVSSTTSAPQPLLPRSGSGGILQVLVPMKHTFNELVKCSNESFPVKVEGFSIDVFKSALDILIPKPTWTDVNYTCFYIGINDTYDAMVTVLKSNKTYDAVVGDVTISASRLENASFTQSYLDSGIVIVTPAKAVAQKFPGVFFVPFTIHTWVVMIVSIALTGLVLWFLERDGNEYLQRTESRSEQFKKGFWFVASILVFFKRESITNPLSKCVMIAWTLFILLLGSSYTASLSSILTVNELSSDSLNITDLSNRNLPVGYQLGSAVSDYLRRHNISNLVPLNSTDDYAHAFGAEHVKAVVDEIPYISLFLAAQSASNCKFAVSSKLTIEGLGFAFYDENLSAAFSVAILNLSESGQMQRLQDGWKLNNFQCPSWVQSTRLDLESSEGLFILLGSAMFVCIVIFVLKCLVLPCRVRTYERMPANQQQDAINAFKEPNFQSIRRRPSARYIILPDELRHL